MIGGRDADCDDGVTQAVRKGRRKSLPAKGVTLVTLVTMKNPLYYVRHRPPSVVRYVRPIVPPLTVIRHSGHCSAKPSNCRQKAAGCGQLVPPARWAEENLTQEGPSTMATTTRRPRYITSGRRESIQESLAESSPCFIAPFPFPLPLPFACAPPSRSAPRAVSPCWLRSSPSISCSSVTRSGMIRSVTL